MGAAPCLVLESDPTADPRSLGLTARLVHPLGHTAWELGPANARMISCYKLARKGFRSVSWFVVSSLPPGKERLVAYACRWWHECGWKTLKSALFDWERGRIVEPERVTVLLIGISCALWAMWLLGRAHEHIPNCKPTTSKPQPRRKSIIKQGIS